MENHSCFMPHVSDQSTSLYLAHKSVRDDLISRTRPQITEGITEQLYSKKSQFLQMLEFYTQKTHNSLKSHNFIKFTTKIAV